MAIAPVASEKGLIEIEGADRQDVRVGWANLNSPISGNPA